MKVRLQDPDFVHIGYFMPDGSIVTVSAHAVENLILEADEECVKRLHEARIPFTQEH